MKQIQVEIKKFNDERGWSGPEQIKDLLLNMSEEVGEMWNIIKWVDTNEQVKLIQKNKEEVENFVGDMIFLILKIAHICEVDSEKAIDDVMDEYEKRFPLEEIKGRHANKLAGGVDKKVIS